VINETLLFDHNDLNEINEKLECELDEIKEIIEILLYTDECFIDMKILNVNLIDTIALE
jgi:hypothetical protein